MSKRVVFVCSLLLLFGLLAGWEMMSSLSVRRLSFNMGVVFIPVSIGLFLGKAVARTVAAVVFCVIYAILGGMLLLSLVSGGGATLPLFGNEIQVQRSFPLVFVAVAMIGSVLGLIHWQLYSQPFEEYLE